MALAHAHLAEYFRRRRLMREAAVQLRRAVAAEARAGGRALAVSAAARVNLGAALLHSLDRPAGLRATRAAARLALAELLPSPPPAAPPPPAGEASSRLSLGRLGPSRSGGGGGPRGAVERRCQACRRAAADCRCRSPHPTAVAYSYAWAPPPPPPPPPPGDFPRSPRARPDLSPAEREVLGPAAGRRPRLLSSYFPWTHAPGSGGAADGGGPRGPVPPEADSDESGTARDGGGGDAEDAAAIEEAERRDAAARQAAALGEYLAALHNECACAVAASLPLDARRPADLAAPLLPYLPDAHPVRVGWARLQAILAAPHPPPAAVAEMVVERCGPTAPAKEQRRRMAPLPPLVRLPSPGPSDSL